jgi:hypothetical protein
LLTDVTFPLVENFAQTVVEANFQPDAQDFVHRNRGLDAAYKRRRYHFSDVKIAELLFCYFGCELNARFLRKSAEINKNQRKSAEYQRNISGNPAGPADPQEIRQRNSDSLGQLYSSITIF